MTDVTEKLARWHLRQSEFDFEVFHWARINYQAADSLSGLLLIEIDDSPLKEGVPEFVKTEAQPEREKPERTRKFGTGFPVMMVWTP